MLKKSTNEVGKKAAVRERLPEIVMRWQTFCTPLRG